MVTKIRGKEDDTQGAATYVALFSSLLSRARKKERGKKESSHLWSSIRSSMLDSRPSSSHPTFVLALSTSSSSPTTPTPTRRRRRRVKQELFALKHQFFLRLSFLFSGRQETVLGREFHPRATPFIFVSPSFSFAMYLHFWASIWLTEKDLCCTSPPHKLDATFSHPSAAQHFQKSIVNIKG